LSAFFDGQAMTEPQENFLEQAISAFQAILDPEQAQKEFFQILHPGESASVCPVCRAPLTVRTQITFGKFGRCLCGRCGKQFTATTGTPFSSSRLTPAEALLLGALLWADAPSHVIAALLGRSQETVISYREKLSGDPADV
jgi:uncharacterized paraquat-inducible protein A